MNPVALSLRPQVLSAEFQGGVPDLAEGVVTTLEPH